MSHILNVNSYEVKEGTIVQWNINSVYLDLIRSCYSKFVYLHVSPLFFFLQLSIWYDYDKTCEIYQFQMCINLHAIVLLMTKAN